jgi:hypothetical protein
MGVLGFWLACRGWWNQSHHQQQFIIGLTPPAKVIDTNERL